MWNNENYGKKTILPKAGFEHTTFRFIDATICYSIFESDLYTYFKDISVVRYSILSCIAVEYIFMLFYK